MKNLFQLRVLTAAVCLAATGATMAAPELMRARSAADPSIETMAPSPMAKEVLFGHTGQWLAGVVSTDWDSQYDEMDIRIADDFTVPEGATWKITEIHAYGGMGSAGGELASANLTFFKDQNGKPGKVVAELLAAPLAKNVEGTFSVKLSSPVKLKAGHYWLSVQGKTKEPGTVWMWNASKGFSGNRAVIQNPGDGYGLGCTDWTPIKDCVGQMPGDQDFELIGVSK
ncbi:choice-of-anchor R domain-containing protein [Ideonella sp. DXS29W]|uniref:Choice-of-anchor R domain-containing protein n=1 Tax=Ideonella lacteola TaxID=2984193 RepID=A0ABU9C008_9BURK